MKVPIQDARCATYRVIKMVTSVSYKLSELIKDSIRAEKRNSDINELLVDILEKEAEWQHDNPHDALTEFKKNYKRLIQLHCPYKGGSN